MCEMSCVKFPEDAKDGDTFSYICPISGCSWVYFVRFMGTWQYLKTE